MILLLLLIIPLIGSLIISMVPVSELSEEEAKAIVSQKLINATAEIAPQAEIQQETEKLLKQENYKRSRNVQVIGMITTLITFIISLYMWVLFDSSVNQYQFVYNFDGISFCHFYIGIDGISLYFVLLTTFLTPIAILANLGSITNNIKYFIISFLLLETLQIALFVVLDLLLFYIFFESILPVLFLVIIIYGTGEERIRSSFLFFLYTLAGSLFMLLAILQIYNYVGSTDFQLLSLSEISLESQIILWAAFFLALAVKTPLIPVHMWLPRAHTSAPLGGSILLAGTVLKFATYGMLRLLIHLFPDASNYCSVVVQVIAIISLIFASLATILQQDTKTLIAYSSICHMAVVVLGLFSNSFIGIIGAILLGIAHGFVSPALFYSVGGIMYERYHKRNIGYYKGLSLTMPVFITLFFIFILANTGIPLTLNFLGEQLSLIGMWERNPIITVLGSTGIVLSACYSIWMYNRISYGSFSPYLSPMPDLNRKEFNLLIALLLPTVIFGIFPSVIIETLDIPTTTLLYITETPVHLDSGPSGRGEAAAILTYVSIGFFSFNKLPNWLKLFVYFTLIVTTSILFKSYTGVSIVKYIFNYNILIFLYLICIVICLLVLFDSILSLYISSNDKKISLPKFLPKLIVNRYNTTYKISRSQNKDLFNKMYFRNIIIDIILLIIAIIGYFVIIK